jgi:hypothetical protein
VLGFGQVSERAIEPGIAAVAHLLDLALTLWPGGPTHASRPRRASPMPMRHR